MITSAANSRIKLVCALARKQARHDARQFAVEGVRLIEEALGAGLVPALAFYSARVLRDARAAALVARLQDATRETYEVSEPVMRSIAATETPQGIIAVLPFVERAAPAEPQFVLIVDAVRDPGNLGTILRAARAAGVDAVLLAPETVDPYNDKVVRAAMGAHFHLPIRAATWAEIDAAVRALPRVYLADARGELDYARADWARPLALIIGSEAEGARDAAIKIATARVRIPMRGGESLNAAMAATVLLFEATRLG